MLFRKKIKKSCQLCSECVPLEEGSFLCKRKGIVAADKKCWYFKYDPCKRIPPKPKALDTSKYSQEDYSL